MNYLSNCCLQYRISPGPCSERRSHPAGFSSSLLTFLSLGLWCNGERSLWCSAALAPTYRPARQNANGIVQVRVLCRRNTSDSWPGSRKQPPGRTRVFCLPSIATVTCKMSVCCLSPYTFVQPRGNGTFAPQVQLCRFKCATSSYDDCAGFTNAPLVHAAIMMSVQSEFDVPNSVVARCVGIYCHPLYVGS